MKDTVIYRAYSKFVDTLSLGNVADERRYVVCIANAVIYSSLMCNTKDKLRIDKVYEYAKELASFLGLSLSFLYQKYSSCNQELLAFVELVGKWNLNRNNADKILCILFEKYINKKETGAYYTDNQTTRYIAKKAIFTYLLDNVSNQVDFLFLLNSSSVQLDSLSLKEKKLFLDKLRNITILDPTCGTGAFLFGALEELLNIYATLGECIDANLIAKVFSRNLYGVDIDAEAIDVLKFRIFLYGKYHWKMDSLSTNNFKVGNTLDSDSFNWQTTYNNIFLESKGFDVIIGNPPYVEYAKMNLRYVKKIAFDTYSCGNLYCYVTERVVKELAHENSAIGFVLPISIVATKRMEPLRELLYSYASDMAFSNFSDRPACLFNGVHQKLSIMFAKMKSSKEYERCRVYSSQYYHWTKDKQNALLQTVVYHECFARSLWGIEKTSSLLQSTILKRVSSGGRPSLLQNVSCRPTPYCVWLNMRMAFWGKSFVHSMESKEYKKFYLNSEQDAKVFSAILNSSLFFFVWECISDCWHITSKELEFIRIDLDEMPDDLKKRISKAYAMFESALETSKVFIGSVRTNYIYQHKLHKQLLDKIDDLLSIAFGLTKEETEFVKRYQENYRLNTEKK